MEGLYVKIYESNGDSSKLKLESYRWEGGDLIAIPEGKYQAEGNKFHFLMCKHCEHQDFSVYGGRFLGEVSCNGCDAYLEIYLHKGE